ncbi:MAG: 6-hydroxymethylpterin diphosphokinase MptE-like protein [Candidatus Hodarchaeota archaeon]
MDESLIIFPKIARQFLDNCIPKIKNKLSLNFDDDSSARDIVHVFLDPFEKIREKREALISSSNPVSTAVIFAPGPSLEEKMDVLGNLDAQSSIFDFIFVDGAAKLALDRNFKIDLLVTDLDGLSDEKILHIHDNIGATVIIHCHGDNIQEIRNFLSSVTLDERYIFTTQASPTSNVYNWGGFTDGDRAIFVALQLKYKKIILVSMDLNARQIGRLSKERFKNLDKKDLDLSRFPIKEKKLEIAFKTLKWLASKEPRAKIFTLSSEKTFPFLENLETIS